MTAPEKVRREAGVIGLLYASLGSIIGSGWLFGALNASLQAGPFRSIPPIRSALRGSIGFSGETAKPAGWWLACFEGAGRERRCASLVGTVQEITERKERQEREHLLMREINHCATN
jgi:hypothetical protein